MHVRTVFTSRPGDRAITFDVPGERAMARHLLQRSH
jgi:hypothetical protein